LRVLTLVNLLEQHSVTTQRSLKTPVVAGCVVLLSLSMLTLQSMAQSAVPASNPVPASSFTPISPTRALALPARFTGLDWNALTPAQQIALKPLAGSWVNLSDGQKRKWISLSANFSLMSSADQARLHTRMVQWAALSPKQREQARLNFAEANKVEPQQKNEKWQAYQALSTEEKQRLAKSAQPKPPRTAIAAKPAASNQINLVPIKKNDGHMGMAASAAAFANSKTLLTRPSAPIPAARPSAPIPGNASSNP
jgi:hypothetical protein